MAVTMNNNQAYQKMLEQQQQLQQQKQAMLQQQQQRIQQQQAAAQQRAQQQAQAQQAAAQQAAAQQAEAQAAAAKAASAPKTGEGLNGVSEATTKKLASYQSGYTQGQGVSDAYKQMQAAQAAIPTTYQASPEVLEAQRQLEALQTSKPQGYTSKYNQQLDEILGQIQNPQEFKFDFNGSKLFQTYADRYTQLGKQAAMNAIGQAAGLTGGYGNSYGATAGSQAQQQYLLGLNDKAMDIYDREYQAYRDKLGDKKDIYGLLSQREAQDYDRYRDTVGDWERERDYLTGRADTAKNFDYGQYRDTVEDAQKNRDYFTEAYQNERNFDYGKYQDERDYWTGQAQAENQDYWNVQDFNEKIRQFNESLDWDKMSTQQKYAAEYAMQILANGGTPSDELLRQAGLSGADAAKLVAAPIEVAAGGGGGGSGKTTLYADANGNLFTVKNGKSQAVSRETIEKNPSKYLVDDKTYKSTVMGKTATSGVKESSQAGKNSGSSSTNDKKLNRVK